MKLIARINISKYKCVTSDIQTDEVVITENQIEHIKTRHPNDYEQYFKYAKEMLIEPDYIIEANKPNTAFILKHILENGMNYQLILRLKTSLDPQNHKNSVITFLKVNEKRYQRYLRTKRILYKSEYLWYNMNKLKKVIWGGQFRGIHTPMVTTGINPERCRRKPRLPNNQSFKKYHSDFSGWYFYIILRIKP